MRRVLLLCLTLTWACTESIPVELPVPADQSALLVVRAPGGRPTVLALDVGDRPPPLSLTSATDVVLLTFEGPLATYGLASGRVDPETAPDAGRPIPASTAAYTWQNLERRWNEETTRPELIDAILLEEPDRCDGEGACFHFFQDRLVCGLPCPEPTPIDAPPPATAPMAWSKTCAAGFTANAQDRCRPTPRVTCAAPNAQLLEDRQCAPLVACPGTRWREDVNPIGEVVYVDAAVAPGGTGTEVAPYDTIAAALAGTAPPATLYLAAGTYEVPAIDGRVVLRGTCPAETELRGAPALGATSDVIVQGVRLATSDLAVRGALRVEDALVAGPRLSIIGTLEMSRVRVVIGAVTNSGTATLEDVVFDPTSSPAIASSGMLTVNGAVLGSAIAVSVTGGDAEVSRVWMSTTTTLPAFSATGGTLVVSDSAFDVGNFAQVSGSAVVRASSVDIVQGAVPTAVLGDGRLTVERGLVTTSARQSMFVVRSNGTLALDRAAFAGAFGELAVAEDTADLILTDVESTDLDPIADLFDEATLDLDRVNANGGIRAGASSSSLVLRLVPGVSNVCADVFAPQNASAVTMTIDDFVARGPLGTAIAPCAGTTATIHNVEIQGAAAGVIADCRGNCADPPLVPDVTVDGLTIAGGEDSTIGVLIRGGDLELAHAAISDVRLYGLYVWGAEANFTDVTVDGVGSDVTSDPMLRDVYCSENRGGGFLRAPGSAFFAEAWSSDFALEFAEVFLTRFAFTNSGCAAMSMGVNGMFTANDGAIVDNLRGLNLVRFGEPVVGEDVIFSGNRQADVYEVGLD